MPGQLNAFNFTRPEGIRQFYLYVPSTYRPNQATGLPLALYFHGYAGNWQQGPYLGMSAVAERLGWAIAYAQGTPSTENKLGWNAGACCLFNASSIVDDVQFARTAVRMIESAVLVDATRRYAMGWSNGAMMVQKLACMASDLFAGVAADEGSVVLSQTSGQDSQLMCDTAFGQRSINYLRFQGTADTTVPCKQASLTQRAVSETGLPAAHRNSAHSLTSCPVCVNVV